VCVARSIADPIGEAGPASYTPPTNPSFPDIATDYWTYEAIECYKMQSVANGYGDGYHPNDTVTRDQMAVYIARAFGLLTMTVPRKMGTEVELAGIRAVGRWNR
jgi:hypothetical protein